jgi:hypothetical protein
MIGSGFIFSVMINLNLSLASSPRIPLPGLNACPPCTPTECYCDDGKKLTLEDMVEAFKVPYSTHLSNSCHYDWVMGVRRFFSRRGQNFLIGVVKKYFLPKKHRKDTFFLKKVYKHTIFCPAGGRPLTRFEQFLLYTLHFQFL